jgi:large subunit ribosomal protein L25
MADENTLSAEKRDSFGKGAARKLRAVGKIPAVIYGHGTEPQHVTLPGHETALLLRKSNVVLTLDIAGDHQLALVKAWDNSASVLDYLLRELARA